MAHIVETGPHKMYETRGTYVPRKEVPLIEMYETRGTYVLRGSTDQYGTISRIESVYGIGYGEITSVLFFYFCCAVNFAFCRYVGVTCFLGLSLS